MSDKERSATILPFGRKKTKKELEDNTGDNSGNGDGGNGEDTADHPPIPCTHVCSAVSLVNFKWMLAYHPTRFGEIPFAATCSQCGGVMLFSEIVSVIRDGLTED